MAENKYYDLPRKRGVDNMGSMGSIVLYAPLGDFETVKGLKTTDTPGDKVTIDGSHVFKSGKGWRRAYATTDTVKAMFETQGERAGRSFKSSFEFFRPGNSKVDAEFARQSPNDEFLFLIKDVNNNRYLQLGSEDFPCDITAGWDSALATSGRKGWTYKAEAPTLGMQFYEGTISLDPTSSGPSASGTEDDETFVD